MPGSLRDLAAREGVSRETIRRRRLALAPSPRPPRAEPKSEPRGRLAGPWTSPDGRAWFSLVALASAYGIHVETLAARLRRRVPMAEALDPRDRRFAGAAPRVSEGRKPRG